jgi:hypothetical protein
MTVKHFVGELTIVAALNHHVASRVADSVETLGYLMAVQMVFDGIVFLLMAAEKIDSEYSVM